MAQKIQNDPEREAGRAAAAKYGARGALWWIEGRTEAEMAALSKIIGTSLGDRIENCKVLLLNATQCAEVFGISMNEWLRKSEHGSLPAAVPVGRTLRWSRATLTEWAAVGCPVGGIPGAESQEQLTRG